MYRKYIYAVVIAFALLFVPLTAAAQIPGIGGSSTQGGVGGGLNDLGQQAPSLSQTNVQLNGRKDVISLIGRIVDWLLYLAGAIAVIFVIIGGYQFLTSGGSESINKKGKNTIVNALIGIVVILLAYVIVNVVVNFFT